LKIINNMKTLMKVIIAVAILGGGYLMLSGEGIGTNLLSQSGSSGVITGDTFSSSTSNEDTQVFGKTLTLTTVATDTSDPAVSYGGDTEFTTICYKDNGSSNVDDWTPLGTGTTANPEVISIPVQAGTKASGGLTEMWCDIDVDSAQDYYVVKDDLIKDNSRISSVIFDDPNGDNVDGWIYNYNLIDVSVANPNQLPTETVFYKLIDEGSITVSDPTSKLSAGTGSATNVLKFKADMDNAGDGEALSRIQITLNGTEDDRWKLNQSFVEIAGVGKIMLSEFSESCTTNCIYKYSLANTVDGANMMFVDKNGDTEIDAHVTIESNLDATDEAICVELELRMVDAQGAFGTATSADAEIAEGATNTDECSI
jgi:hypothetical protein